MSQDDPGETLDWFQAQRRLEALKDAFVQTYADSVTEIQFYAVESFDTFFCEECQDETEILEEVEVKFAEESIGGLRAEILRLRSPRRYCRECLSAISLE